MTSEPSTPGALRGHRVLVGPNDVAGFASRIAAALAGNGADVLFFNANDHPFNPHVAENPRLKRLFWAAITLASRWKKKGGVSMVAGSVLARMVKLAAFLKTCLWAKTVVMVGGKGFFVGGVEYALLRALGKRVIHVFVGTASRPRYLSGYAKGAIKDGKVHQKEIKRLARRTARQAARVRGISRHASLVVENPLCGHFHEKPFVNFFKLGVPLDVDALLAKPRITDHTPPRAPGKVRVLHCPSRPEIKGSVRIREVVEKLIAEGLPLELRFVTGVPHGQVLHEITQADFVVDQLYSDVPLAGFAAEASAFGKAAVVGGYGWDLFPGFMAPGEMPPTVWVHPDRLEEALRNLALDAVARDAAGADARTFLRTNWSETAFAERFARLVVGEVPDDWWFRPESVRYAHGLGMEETEARRLIGALIERSGPSALAVDHLPGLDERLTAFAKGDSGDYRTVEPAASRLR